MKRGFTLIEVLLSLALLALLLSVVQGVYSGVSRSRESARAATDGLRAASLILQRMADEIGSADPQTISLSEESAEFSKLEFVTELSDYAQEEATSGRPVGGLTQVLYEAAEIEGVKTLTRQGGRLSTTGDAELRDPDPLLRGVSRFRVKVSPDAKAWRESWEPGGGTGSDAYLPRIASIEIGWREGGPEGLERVLRTSAALYRE
jgi:prepilin-type N-terminal cleavage/methylation domain-containing protein